MPDWLDAKTFDEAMKVMVITFDFVFGGRKLHKLIAKISKYATSAGFGEPASHEMNKLRAGNLLKTWINDMKTMISQSNETYKAIFYSAVSSIV